MTETEFIEQAEQLFSQIEKEIEAACLDVDCDRSGNVLTLESDNGQQVVINLHTPTQQVWLASRQGGLHFQWQAGRWTATRDGSGFWQALSQAVSFICQCRVDLTGS